MHKCIIVYIFDGTTIINNLKQETMKNQILILAISLVTLSGVAQSTKTNTVYPKLVNDKYEPIEVIRKLKSDFNDTSYVLSTNYSVVYQNYRYSYMVWETGSVINAELTKKEKLCSRKDFIFHRNKLNSNNN